MRVLIMFTSMTGNDEAIADILFRIFNDNCVQADVSRIEDTDHACITNYDVLVVVSYTYEDGEVPRPAYDFYEWLEHEKLSSLTFGVCGSGDTFYEDFCTAVDNFDSRLENTGAIRGADPVKVELYPEAEDKQRLGNFVLSILNTKKGHDENQNV